jgi:hypothetical protein
MAWKTLSTLVCGLVLLVLGPGCKGQGQGKKKSAPARPGTLTVESVGAQPRMKLRYRVRPGEKLTYRMTSHRKISGLPGHSGPVSLTLSVSTDRVRGRRARLRWRVEQVASGSPRLRGLDLWVETSDRGEISTVSRGRPRPRTAQQLQQSVRQIYLAWPAKAVGPGARWTQRRDLILAASTKGGFRAKVVARYSFDRVAPCGQGRCVHLSLRTTLELSHKAGKVNVLGKGEGSGRVIFDLERGRLLESHTQAAIGLSTSLAPNKVIQKITLKQSLLLTR